MVTRSMKVGCWPQPRRWPHRYSRSWTATAESKPVHGGPTVREGRGRHLLPELMRIRSDPSPDVSCGLESTPSLTVGPLFRAPQLRQHLANPIEGARLPGSPGTSECRLPGVHRYVFGPGEEAIQSVFRRGAFR